MKCSLFNSWLILPYTSVTLPINRNIGAFRWVHRCFDTHIDLVTEQNIVCFTISRFTLTSMWILQWVHIRYGLRSNDMWYSFTPFNFIHLFTIIHRLVVLLIYKGIAIHQEILDSHSFICFRLQGSTSP